MTPEIKAILLKRAKSLLWRAACMAGIGLIGFLVEQLSLFHIPPFVLAVVGLMAGEATKWLRDHTNMLGAKLKS